MVRKKNHCVAQWSAEKPVVAGDAGGHPENINSFMNGIKVQMEPGSLAWGISHMIRDPGNAQVMGNGSGEKWTGSSSGDRPPAGWRIIPGQDPVFPRFCYFTVGLSKMTQIKPGLLSPLIN